MSWRLRIGCLLGAALIAAPVAASAPAEPPAAASDLLYVTSQSGAAVSVIDMQAQEIVATVDLTELGFSPNCKAHDVAVEPDGSHYYVSLIADWRVLKFDRDNHLVGQVEFETPGLLAIDPSGDVLYVGRSMAAVNPPQRIGVIQLSDMGIEEVDVFFPRPHALAVAPGGGLVYTASLVENRMATVNPAQDDLELFDVPGDTHTFVQFAVSPDGETLVAGGQISGQILVFDISDPRAPTLTKTFELGGQPWHPVFAPDGSIVYFPQRTRNSVAVIDARSWELVGSIEGDGLAEPHGSAISADGRWLWVSGENTKGTYGKAAEGEMPPGTVVVIDTATRQVVKVIEVPAYGAGMATRLVQSRSSADAS